MFDGVGKHGESEPGKMSELLERLDTGTTTPADRAMLDNLPPCDQPPHELVRLVENLRHEV